MNSEFAYLASVGWLSSFMLQTFISTTKSFVANARQTEQNKRLRLTVAKAAARYRPQITAVIYSHRSVADTLRCLDSLRLSRYRKLEVIVIDDASRDGTTQQLKDYKKTYPKLSLRIVSKRVFRGPEQAIDALRISKDKILLCLPAQAQVRPGMLQELIPYFYKGSPKVTFVPQFESHYSIQNILKHMATFDSSTPMLSRPFGMYVKSNVDTAPPLYHEITTTTQSADLDSLQVSRWPEIVWTAVSVSFITYFISLALHDITHTPLLIVFVCLAVRYILTLFDRPAVGLMSRIELIIATPIWLLYSYLQLGVRLSLWAAVRLTVRS